MNQYYQDFNEVANNKNKQVKMGKAFIAIIILIILAIISIISYLIVGKSLETNKNNTSKEMEQNISKNSIKTEQEMKIELNKLPDEPYYNSLEFEIINISTVNHEYAFGYKKANKEVARVIMFVKNGLRLTKLAGFNYGVNLSLVLSNNLTSETLSVHKIANSFDAILVAYFEGENLNVSNKNIKLIKDTKNNIERKIKLSNNIFKPSTSNKIKPNTITELSNNHYIYVYAAEMYGHEEYNEPIYAAYDGYAMLEWGENYSSIINGTFELINKDDLSKATDDKIIISKRATIESNGGSNYMIHRSPTEELNKYLNSSENFYKKSVWFSTFMTSEEVNNQGTLPSRERLKKYLLKYTEKGNVFYFGCNVYGCE